MRVLGFLVWGEEGDFKESLVKKLKEIKVEGSHKAQGIEVSFVGARRVAKVYWDSIQVCVLL